MKTLRTLALSALALAPCLAANATATFWGDGFGDIGFGLSARPSGGESVAFGDYAGNLAEDAWRTAFLGAYAGRLSRSMHRSVYLGDEAGQGSSLHDGVVAIGSAAASWSRGMTNVVAIGDWALAGWGNLCDATWINGQVYISKGDGIFITDDPSRQFADAPAFYTNGCWTLQGSLVVRGEMLREDPGTGDVVDPLGVWQGDYDYYVDGYRGLDTNSGRLGQPFQTLTGAVARIAADIDTGAFTNGVPTVAVSRGSYEYLGEIATTNAINFVAISGKGSTFIEPQTSGSPHRMGMPNSDDVTSLPVFKGFTFRGFNASSAYGGTVSSRPWWRNASFFLVAFEDCTFEDAPFFVVDGKSSTVYCYVFSYCILEKCEVRPTVRFRSVPQGPNPGNAGARDPFFCSEFYSSVIRFGEDVSDTESYSHLLSYSCHFDNCFVEKPKVGWSSVMRRNAGYPTVSGLYPSVTNSTIRIGTNVNGSSSVSANYLWNSIYSVGSNSSGVSGTNFFPAYDEIAYGDDLRPTDFSKRFFGYMSGNDRGLKNAILSDVADALSNEGYPSNVVVRLLARRQPAAVPAAAPARPMRMVTPICRDPEDIDLEYEE